MVVYIFTAFEGIVMAVLMWLTRESEITGWMFVVAVFVTNGVTLRAILLVLWTPLTLGREWSKEKGSLGSMLSSGQYADALEAILYVNGSVKGPAGRLFDDVKCPCSFT